jgi:hypothetical protein
MKFLMKQCPDLILKLMKRWRVSWSLVIGDKVETRLRNNSKTIFRKYPLEFLVMDPNVVPFQRHSWISCYASKGEGRSCRHWVEGEENNSVSMKQISWCFTGLWHQESLISQLFHSISDHTLNVSRSWVWLPQNRLCDTSRCRVWYSIGEVGLRTAMFTVTSHWGRSRVTSPAQQGSLVLVEAARMAWHDPLCASPPLPWQVGSGVRRPAEPHYC